MDNMKKNVIRDVVVHKNIEIPMRDGVILRADHSGAAV